MKKYDYSNGRHFRWSLRKQCDCSLSLCVSLCRAARSRSSPKFVLILCRSSSIVVSVGAAGLCNQYFF